MTDLQFSGLPCYTNNALENGVKLQRQVCMQRHLHSILGNTKASILIFFIKFLIVFNLSKGQESTSPRLEQYFENLNPVPGFDFKNPGLLFC